MTRVIVIGSGFGGAIAAKRFAEAGHAVTVLELGEDFAACGEVPPEKKHFAACGEVPPSPNDGRDPEKARQSQDPRFVGRLLRGYPPPGTRPAISVVLGMGVGGGSLVYSGIHLRAPEHAFAGWPGGYTRARLDPYYARVEQRLAVAAPADAFAFARPRLFAEGARRAGLPPARPNPLAMQGCTRCGWCVPLCAFGKKQTMPLTYLADAAATGRLTIRAHRKAMYVERRSGAGARYRVHAIRTDGVARDYHRVVDGAREVFDADVVVIAAGAIESPVLLARSRPALHAFDAARLGRGLDGTGDFVQGGFVPARTDSFKGAVMMAHVDLGDYVLEDIHGVPVGATVALDVVPPGATKNWGRDYLRGFRDYGRRALAIAIVGKQASARTIEVHDDGGNAVVGGRAYQPAPGALAAARSIITALGGEPTHVDTAHVLTVHPTGGCALGDVVRADDLQVHENPGLHVIDGSVLPENPLRNPSHTICAIAERALDVILDGRRW